MTATCKAPKPCAFFQVLNAIAVVIVATFGGQKHHAAVASHSHARQRREWLTVLSMPAIRQMVGETGAEPISPFMAITP